MNQLEKIAEENMQNHTRYLSRMHENTLHTTKALIPAFLKPSRILDVGCGDGTLLALLAEYDPMLELAGIDLNSHQIQHCLSQYSRLPIQFRQASLQEVCAEENEKYDTILFSSILHEISSYDENAPFTARPIAEMLRLAHSLLAEGGRVIIRDGCGSDDDTPITFRFRNPSDVAYIHRFANEFQPNYLGKKGNQKELQPISPLYQEVNGAEVLLPLGYAKEFLVTYTWGEESWNREIREKYGILTQREWLDIAEKNGFFVKTYLLSAESYPKYLSERIEFAEEDNLLLRDFVILLVLEKIG